MARRDAPLHLEWLRQPALFAAPAARARACTRSGQSRRCCCCIWCSRASSHDDSAASTESERHVDGVCASVERDLFVELRVLLTVRHTWDGDRLAVAYARRTRPIDLIMLMSPSFLPISCTRCHADRGIKLPTANQPSIAANHESPVVADALRWKSRSSPKCSESTRLTRDILRTLHRSSPCT